MVQQLWKAVARFLDIKLPQRTRKKAMNPSVSRWKEIDNIKTEISIENRKQKINETELTWV